MMPFHLQPSTFTPSHFRGAGWQPAVSPTDSRRNVKTSSALRIANPRYSRLPVCATLVAASPRHVLASCRLNFKKFHFQSSPVISGNLQSSLVIVSGARSRPAKAIPAPHLVSWSSIHLKVSTTRCPVRTPRRRLSQNLNIRKDELHESLTFNSFFFSRCAAPLSSIMRTPSMRLGACFRRQKAVA
jgi:hypothetical protein